MGGVYGAATGMALENIPNEARGLFSGIFQVSKHVSSPNFCL